MNTRLLSHSALVISVLAGLTAAPAFAAESVLVTHDEGNSGPFLIQVDHAPAPVQTLSSAPTLVLHDEGNSGPSLVLPQTSHAVHTSAVQVPHQDLLARDDGMSAPQVIIR